MLGSKPHSTHSIINVNNDPSSINKGLNLLDTGMGILGFFPGFQLPVLIYTSVRIGYDVYESYKKPRK
jgi:hypothetical protein